MRLHEYPLSVWGISEVGTWQSRILVLVNGTMRASLGKLASEHLGCIDCMRSVRTSERCEEESSLNHAVVQP